MSSNQLSSSRNYFCHCWILSCEPSKMKSRVLFRKSAQTTSLPSSTNFSSLDPYSSHQNLWTRPEPNKCVVVPLGKPTTDEIFKAVKDYIVAHVPELARFRDSKQRQIPLNDSGPRRWGQHLADKAFEKLQGWDI